MAFDIEILGFAASVIIFASGIMQSEMWLRAVNIVGALLMAIYGIIIHAPSVVLLNVGMVVAHVYRIVKIRKGRGEEA